MNPLEKIKLVNELNKTIKMRNTETHPLKKLSLTKRIIDLTKLLNEEIEQEINIETLNTDLSNYLVSHSIFEAVRLYYRENLQGKFVETEIGQVHLTGATWQKMKSGLKSDELKAALIPFVPQILKGHYDGRRELTKERKDRYIAFHAFSNTIKLQNLMIHARVTVGETEHHQYEYIAYSLHYSDDTKAILPITQVDSLRGQNSLVTDSKNDLAVDNVRSESSIVNDDDWNIEFISITDLNGNIINLGELNGYF